MGITAGLTDEFRKSLSSCQYNLRMETVELAALLADGNIGVASVLKGILDKDYLFIEMLSYVMNQTHSEPSLIWVVYKDICDHDIDKTIEYLKKWNITKMINLNDYIKKNNPEARHY